MFRAAISCASISLAAAVSGGHRAVFIAGLEGTGHHFWSDVFKDCAEQGSCQKPPAKIAPSLDNLLPPFWATWREHIDETPAGSLTVLNTLSGTGELSYPNGWDGVDNPRLALYARGVLENGDDLKVILTLRNADDIMESAQRRWGHSEDALVASANVLLDDLSSVQKGSLLCVDHDSLSERGDEVREFLEAGHGESTLPFDYASAFRARWNQSSVHECDGEACRAPKLAAVVEQLRAACSYSAPSNFLAERQRRYGRKHLHSHEFHDSYAHFHQQGRV